MEKLILTLLFFFNLETFATNDMAFINSEIKTGYKIENSKLYPLISKTDAFGKDQWFLNEGILHPALDITQIDEFTLEAKYNDVIAERDAPGYPCYVHFILIISKDRKMVRVYSQFQIFSPSMKIPSFQEWLKTFPYRYVDYIVF